MATDRKFAAFAKDGRHGLGVAEVPNDGFCISVFVVLSPAASRDLVLMGRLDPRAPWDHIGALDGQRAEVHSQGWMLPSSHLIYGEAPDAAAIRVAKEQLGLEGIPFGAPTVYSEVYASKRHPAQSKHWDLEFVFRGSVDPSAIPAKHPAWRELNFVDTRSLDPSEVARSHEDIIARMI